MLPVINACIYLYASLFCIAIASSFKSCLEFFLNFCNSYSLFFPSSKLTMILCLFGIVCLFVCFFFSIFYVLLYQVIFLKAIIYKV